MGSGGYSCMRRTFCWLNILILICSCAFLGAGLWLRLAYQGEYVTLLPDHAALSADSLLLTAGVMGFVITFFGCCGSWFQSRCLLICYFTLLVLLFLTEFLLGSLAFVFRGGIGRTLANELKYGIEKYYNSSDLGGRITPSVASIWDSLQKNVHCCGVNSYEDWYDISSWPQERWVPDSCCRTIYNESFSLVEGSGYEIPASINCSKSHNPSLWWSHGCLDAIQMWLLHRLHVVGAVGLIIAFIQLFGLLTSMLLFCTMRHRKKEEETYKSYSPTTDNSQRNRSINSYIDE